MDYNETLLEMDQEYTSFSDGFGASLGGEEEETEGDVIDDITEETEEDEVPEFGIKEDDEDDSFGGETE